MTESRKNKPGPEDYERIICQIKGVLGARLVTDSNGDLSEIHIMALSGRSPKQIVRDVESAILVQLGVAVDHKKISIVQVEDPALPGEVREDRAMYTSTSCRLRLISINLFTRGPEAEATVEVEVGSGGGSTVYQGHAFGPNAPEHSLRLVAAATVNALTKYCGSNWSLALEDLVWVEVAHRRAALCALILVTAVGSEYLVGVTLAEGDERQAAAQAVLHALSCRFCNLQGLRNE
ncbi:hypothetical protein SDD30_08430 [Moorella naiadis]|uniref:hypothetical protein n=1 Tax=Moorella naiadis (nom. illeg.) TaxID=3093670 RepID=UPI003D9C9298